MDKRNLVLEVTYLNAIIGKIKCSNCYDIVLPFFKTTTYLQDHEKEITQLPLKGFQIFGYKSRSRKNAEAQRESFIKNIRLAGRDNKHNHSMPGGIVTKDNIEFGNACGVVPGRVSRFETSPRKEIQEVVRPQIVEFVSSFKDSFSLSWLR